MKLFVLSIVILFAGFIPGSSFTTKSQESPNGEVPGTCEQAAIELAGFKDVSTVWGTTQEGDPWSSSKQSLAGGEWFAHGVTVYKSKSRFKKRVRQMVEDVAGLTGRTSQLNEQGRQIGQRIVKEARTDGKLTSVTIFLITDRMIQGISAPTLKLALMVEKANIFCRAESERRQKSR